MKIDERLFEKGARIGVALSGGRDSASLFHYLLSKKELLGIEVVAITVEHGIREESKRESALIKEHCDALGVPCKVYTVDCLGYAKRNKKTIEQSARNLRYECFDNAIKDGFCDYIATAHHQGDDVETVLMRIFRGTGIKGLGGISETRDYILRPMLNTSRLEIDEYCKENNIKYFEDQTNTDEKYTRNFIRRSVLPLIREKYPSVDDAILRLARTSSKDEEYFDALTAGKVKVIDQNAVSVSAKDLDSEAVGYRIIVKAFAHLGVIADIEERHISLILKLKSAENGTFLDMPYFIKVVKEYDDIVFTKSVDKFRGEIVFSGTDLSLTVGENEYKMQKVANLTGLCVDGDKVLGAVIRTRRDGDIFKRFGGGTKSLGDYFTDIKYPARLRDNALVLAKDNEVLAVFGVEISEKAKITDQTKNIYKLHGGENVFRRI